MFLHRLSVLGAGLKHKHIFRSSERHFFPKWATSRKGDSQILVKCNCYWPSWNTSGSTGHTITVFSNLGTNRLTLGSLVSTIKFQNSFEQIAEQLCNDSQVKVKGLLVEILLL